MWLASLYNRTEKIKKAPKQLFDYKPRFAGNGADDAGGTAHFIDFNANKAGKFRFSHKK